MSTIQQLETACIDCTKYDLGDAAGQCLALLCHASYLSVVYLLSVHFRGEACLICLFYKLDLLKRLLVSCVRAVQVFYAKRDLRDGAILAGAVANAGLGRALKSVWRQPRPSARYKLPLS